MRTIALIALGLAACAGAVSPDFKAYKAKFGKTYASPDEEAQAKACWEENIKDLAKKEAMHSDVHFEENQFSDQCWEDFVAERAPLDHIDGTCLKSPVPAYTKKADETKATDWRDHGYVNAVKNQESCGSCWAFSAVGCMEGAAFKATGNLPSLSEQDLVSCDTTNNGCKGGMPGEAFAWAVQTGMATESEYPYEGKSSSCKHSGPGSVRFSSWQYLPTNKPGSFGGGGEPVLLAAVQNEGPISITVNANQVWQQYSGGIVDTDSCPGSSSINHAVLAVGYGIGSKAYWIVRNSWGTGWGEKGYIRLAYNKNVCSIQACLSAMIVGGGGPSPPTPPGPSPPPSPPTPPSPPSPPPSPPTPPSPPSPPPPSPTDCMMQQKQADCEAKASEGCHWCTFGMGMCMAKEFPCPGNVVV